MRLQRMLLFLAATLVASAALGADCPKLTVTGADDVPKGKPIVFTASVEGGDQNVTPTYNWSISAGTIESGQGTSTITIQTTDLDADMSVTATVDVGGYDPDCAVVSSATATIIAPK